MSMTLPLSDTAKVVSTLDTLLRCELSATETYQQAIEKLGPEATGEMFDCLYSHQFRAEFLDERIVDLHGLPAVGGGPWAAFTDLFADDPSHHPDLKTVLAVLKDGEAQCLNMYHEDLDDLDMASLRLVEQELLPEQHRTMKGMDTAFAAAP